MSPPSLREIEKALSALWSKRDTLESFLDGGDSGIDPEIARQINTDRLLIYADVVHYGKQEVMDSIYPLCAHLLRRKWEDIIRDYLEVFPPRDFRLNLIARHFPQYVEEHLYSEYEKRLPFLKELAEYEWLEMELMDQEEEPVASELCTPRTPDEFASYRPIVNPALVLRRYQYPIIKIAEKLEEKKRLRNVKPVDTNVVIYRDPTLHHCRFLEVGPVAFAVLEKALEGHSSYSDLVSLAVSMSPDADPQATVTEFLTMMETLKANHLFLGNKKLT